MEEVLMRRIFSSLLLSIALLVAVSCAESTTASNAWVVALHANYIHPDRQSLDFPDPNGGTFEFTVNSQDTPWKITGMPDWLEVSPTSGKGTTNVRVTVSKYELAAARVAVLTLSSDSSDWQYNTSITVNQSGAPAYANLSDASLTFDGQAHEGQVTVAANCSWSVATTESWVRASRGDDGYFTYSVQENPYLESREATIQVSYNGSVISSVKVTQRASQVDVVTNPLNYGNVAGTYKLNVKSDAAWSAYTGYPWISMSPESGAAGVTELTVSVAPNTELDPRDGFVYLRFTASNVQIAEIPVHQDGIQLQLGDGEDAITFESSLAQTSTIRVTSNTDWYFSNIPSWITVEPSSGTGTVDVKLNIQENNHYWFRGYDNLTVTRTDSWYGVSRSIGQNARTLDLNTTYMQFLDVAQTQYVEVKTEGSWALNYSSDFFSATPVEATGNGQIAVSVGENRSDQTREGNIEFRLLGMPDYENGYDARNITVWQPAWSERYRNLQSDIAIPAMGGAVDIWLDTNDNWSVALSENASWIRFEENTSGTGSANLHLAFDTNNSINARGVKAVVSFAYMDPVEITITQPGRTMHPNCESIFFFAKGGGNTVTVTADGNYKLEQASGDWFTLAPGENNTFTVTAPENTTGAVREGAVRLTLLDLTEGSMVITIPVVQTTKEVGFTRDGFGEDVNLDLGTGSGITISVVSFSGDADWNSKYSISVKVTGFDADSDWNRGINGSVSIGGEGYDDDENWN